MPPVPSIRITGDKAVSSLLRSIEKRVSDLSPVFAGPIDKSVTMLFRRQFASRGAFGGQAWAPLRPSTKRWRERSGGNRGGVAHPLWDTGEGKASFEKVGPNSFFKITRSSYERGSTLPRMAMHQAGYVVSSWGGRGLRHPRTVPARQSIPDPLPTFVTGAWTVLISRYLDSGGTNG